MRGGGGGRAWCLTGTKPLDTGAVVGVRAPERQPSVAQRVVRVLAGDHARGGEASPGMLGPGGLPLPPGGRSGLPARGVARWVQQVEPSRQLQCVAVAPLRGAHSAWRGMRVIQHSRPCAGLRLQAGIMRASETVSQGHTLKRGKQAARSRLPYMMPRITATAAHMQGGGQRTRPRSDGFSEHPARRKGSGQASAQGPCVPSARQHAQQALPCWSGSVAPRQSLLLVITHAVCQSGMLHLQAAAAPLPTVAGSPAQEACQASEAKHTRTHVKDLLRCTDRGLFS